MTNYITRKEAANILRVHVSSVDRYIHNGTLKAVKFGGNIRIDLDDLKAFILGTEQARVDAAKADAGLS